MSKKIVIWTLIVIALALGVYWYSTYRSSSVVLPAGGATPVSVGTDKIAAPLSNGASSTPIVANVDKNFGIVPNAIIPTSTADTGGMPVFGPAPKGLEKGGKNPPVTDQPVVTSTSSAAATTSVYKAPVTDRPVVTQ